MRSRPIFVAYGFLLLLLPTLTWALNEAGDTPPVQSETTLTAPVQPVPEPAAPTKPSSALAAPTAPTPAEAGQTTPAQLPLKKSLPFSNTPAKPASPLAAPAKPSIGPANPLNPGIAPPSAKPNVSPATPLKPGIAPAAPVPTPLKNALPVKPVPVQSAPAPSTPPQAPATAIPNVTILDNHSETVDIEVFIRDDCPTCEKAKEFIAKLRSLQPHLKIIFRDVRKEPAALELLKRMVQNQGGDAIDYPAFVVGGQLIIGFTEEAGTAQLILDTLMASHPRSQDSSNDSESCHTGKEPSCGLIPPTPIVKQENINVTIFGVNVPLLQIGLPLFTLALGLLDGLNHGSTWVLMLLLALFSPLKNRPLMIAVGGAFITVQGIVYFGLLAAWLNIVLLIKISYLTEVVIASIAILAGVFYFVKYIQFGNRISISSHEITKPGIYSHIRKIVQTESLSAVLLSTALLALMVQAAEFTYTSVFPALYTRVLTLQHLGTLHNYGYLLLYDFAYMLDDLIILAIGVINLSQDRPQEREGRILKLISALALVSLGVYLFVARYDLWGH